MARSRYGFTVGERIMMTDECPRTGLRKHGVVVGFSRKYATSPQCVRVKFDGLKTPQSYNVKFIQQEQL
jgi:hypothetical protein